MPRWVDGSAIWDFQGFFPVKESYTKREILVVRDEIFSTSLLAPTAAPPRDENVMRWRRGRPFDVPLGGRWEVGGWERVLLPYWNEGMHLTCPHFFLAQLAIEIDKIKETEYVIQSGQCLPGDPIQSRPSTYITTALHPSEMAFFIISLQSFL